MSNYKKILDSFNIRGEIIDEKAITIGNINTTVKVVVLNGDISSSYIIQKINKFVFKNPVSLMDNIGNISEFLKTKVKDDRFYLNFLKTKDGKYYYLDEDMEYYRCYKFIDNSKTFNEIEDIGVLEEVGSAFGEFQKMMSEYDATSLNETIKDFHNTYDRYLKFEEAIKKDSFDRLKDTKELVDNYLLLKDDALKLYGMEKEGLLPYRVTHNDTKINNVLFDIESFNHLAVIDLDTVMKGLMAYDYGDLIRSASVDAFESSDKSRMINLRKFKAITKGFLNEVKDIISDSEFESLKYGIFTMTVELGIRFLTDYLEGDVYFKIKKNKDDNLRKSINLYYLAKDILSKDKEIDEILINLRKCT